MATSKIKADFPYKTLVVRNVKFTFNNAVNAGKLLSDITNIVTSENIIAVFGTPFGFSGCLAMNGARNYVDIRNVAGDNLNATYNVNLLFLYR